MTGALVVGLGNTLRRDDGVGIRLLEVLRASSLVSSVALVQCAGDVATLLSEWDGRELVVLVDAMVSGGTAGTIVRHEPLAEPLHLHETRHSTHGLGVAQVIALGAGLGKLPARLVVFGVEVADTGWGEGLSPAVEAALPSLAARVLDELHAVGNGACLGALPRSLPNAQPR